MTTMRNHMDTQQDALIEASRLQRDAMKTDTKHFASYVVQGFVESGNYWWTIRPAILNDIVRYANSKKFRVAFNEYKIN
jgi:hypothetical protein